MSTNNTIKNTASSAAATPPPRLKWDNLDGIRTVIVVLYQRFPYWNASQYAKIINFAFKPQFAAMGFPDGIDNHRIGAEWRSRDKENAKAKWELGDDLDVSEEVASNRDMWESTLRIAAVKVGLQPRDESDSGDDDESEEDDAQTKAKRAQETKEAVVAFKKKHYREDGNGEGGEGGEGSSAGNALTLG